MECCTIEIRLQPRSSRNAVKPFLTGDGYNVSVTSPAVENRANDHCVALLAEKLRLPKSSLAIIRGGHSRNKVISCKGITAAEAGRLLRE